MTNDFRRSSRRVFLAHETPPDLLALLDEAIAEFLDGKDEPEMIVEERGDFFVLRLPDDEGEA